MIRSISLKNFRGFNKVLEFGPLRNLLKGPNEAGKSTVKEAICFVLYGCDSAGAKNPDHLITIGEEETEVALTTDKAVFIRKKKKDKPSGVWLSRQNLPQTKLSQSDLNGLLQMSFEVFSSAFEVGSFMRLPQAKQLEVLNAVSPVDRGKLFWDGLQKTKTLLESDVEKLVLRTVGLENPRIEATRLATERRKLQNILSKDQGSLEICDRKYDELKVAKHPEITTEDLQVLEARQALYARYERDLDEYNRKLAEHSEQGLENKKRQAEREKVELELKAMGACIGDDEIETHEAEIRKCQQQLRDLAQKSTRVPPEPPKLQKSLDSGSTCVRCGQIVSDKAAASMEEERERALNEYNKQARMIEDENKQAQEQISAVEARQEALLSVVRDKRKSKQAYSDKKNLLERKLLSLKSLSLPAPVPPTMPDGYRVEASKELSAKLLDLKAAIRASTYFADMEHRLYDERLDLLKSIDLRKRHITQLEVVEGVLKALPSIEARITTEAFQIGHGLRVVFEEGAFAVYDELGCPFASMSTGKQMKVSLLIAQKLQSLLAHPPKFYFVDNEDLIDHVAPFLPVDSQIFTAKVDWSIKELQVIQLN